MGMNVGGKKGQVGAEINLTPLIDVVLVLLIIFMVLTPSMLKHMTANVPRQADVNTPPQPPGTEPVVVKYTKDREISVNGNPVTFEGLVAKVTDELKSRPQSKVVFFNVDDDAIYGEVVKMMDLVRGAGAKTLGIVTKEASAALGTDTPAPAP